MEGKSIDDLRAPSSRSIFGEGAFRHYLAFGYAFNPDPGTTDSTVDVAEKGDMLSLMVRASARAVAPRSASAGVPCYS